MVFQCRIFEVLDARIASVLNKIIHNSQFLLKHGWEKIPNWECLFVHREQGFFLSVYVDDKKIGWKEKQNIDPMWKILNKEVDLGEPTSFLDHVYLGMHSNDNAK